MRSRVGAEFPQRAERGGGALRPGRQSSARRPPATAARPASRRQFGTCGFSLAAPHFVFGTLPPTRLIGKMEQSSWGASLQLRQMLGKPAERLLAALDGSVFLDH